MLTKHSAAWLNSERLIAYPRLIFFIFLLGSMGWVLSSQGLVDPRGKPLGADFITFWSASKLGMSGRADDAYRLDIIADVEKMAVPGVEHAFAWFYPPPFYLIILPLSLMPYLVAFGFFVGTTLLYYIQSLTRIMSGRVALWCITAFPGLWICLLHGQNAFLTAALAGSGILAMPRRPILAGILVGLLVIKPHLGILFPVALLASGRWKVFFWAACSAIALLVAGFMVFGWDAYIASFHSIQEARAYMESGVLPWGKMPSWFALLRGLGANITISYIFQIVFSTWGIVLTWKIWRDSNSWAMRGSALMTATLLISPFLYDYDLAWLGFPLCWLARLGIRDGWAPMEIEILVAAWFLPLLMPLLANSLSLQAGPIVLSALLWTIWRRHLGELSQMRA